MGSKEWVGIDGYHLFMGERERCESEEYVGVK